MCIKENALWGPQMAANSSLWRKRCLIREVPFHNWRKEMSKETSLVSKEVDLPMYWSTCCKRKQVGEWPLGKKGQIKVCLQFQIRIFVVEEEMEWCGSEDSANGLKEWFWSEHLQSIALHVVYLISVTMQNVC